MTNDAAAVALEQLIKAANISRTVYVDDIFAFQDDIEVEQAIGWFAQALAMSQDRSLALMQVTFRGPDDDIWRQEFRDKWERLTRDERIAITNGISGILNSQLKRDNVVASKLKQLFPSEFDYREVSPSSWNQNKHEMLADESDDSCIICLFDLDLSADSGFSSTGAMSGGGLLKELLASQRGSKVFCGIFSHTIASIEDEGDYLQEFISSYGIDEPDTNRFLPLAKARLGDPMKFVDGFKKLLLHETCEIIKGYVLEILDDAHKAAVEKVRSLDVYAFDRMVMKTAYRENESEADIVIRLFQIFQRSNVRSQVLSLGSSSGLNERIAAARPLSEVKTIEEEFVYPQVRQIRIDELYENSDLTRNQPLAIGDIFVSLNGTGAESKSYVLLAQPCDLAVRQDGSRVQSFVSLIPIKKVSIGYGKDENNNRLWSKNFWSTRALIDNFFPTSDDLAILEFKNAISVRIDVLDLAVLNPDGRCRIDLKDTSIPNQLTDGWKKRLQKCMAFFNDVNSRLEIIRNMGNAKDSQRLQNDILKYIFPTSSAQAKLPKVIYDDGTFDFYLLRKRRYRQPGADHLLTSFTQYLSRAAKDFDFAE